MSKNIIFVTGFFGAPTMQTAQALAEEKGYNLKVLDKEIEKADGRSARRICMMMGEHEYRNKEYEALKSIVDEYSSIIEASSVASNGIVVCCGDGVLHDDMSKELIESYELIVLGGNLSCEELWNNAKEIDDSYHAFMCFGTEEEKHSSFVKLHERQRVLFTPYIV